MHGSSFWAYETFLDWIFRRKTYYFYSAVTRTYSKYNKRYGRYVEISEQEYKSMWRESL